MPATGSWLVYCVLVLVLWGVWAFLPRLSAESLGAPSVPFYQQIGAIVAAIAVLASVRFKLVSEPRGVALALLTGVLGVAGLLCYLQAVVRYRLSVVVMLTALYPIVTVALSMAVLRERLSGVQWIGVGFALVAILLLSTPSR